MKLKEAMNIIKKSESGFMVHFEKIDGNVLISDYFPEKEEALIKDEDEAWELAKRFAKATNPEEIVNIYVTDQDYSPVVGYVEKKIRPH